MQSFFGSFLSNLVIITFTSLEDRSRNAKNSKPFLHAILVLAPLPE